MVVGLTLWPKRRPGGEGRSSGAEGCLRRPCLQPWPPRGRHCTGAGLSPRSSWVRPPTCPAMAGRERGRPWREMLR